MRFSIQNKNQLILFNIIIAVVSIYFTYSVYLDYKKSLDMKANNYIEGSIDKYYKSISNLLVEIRENIKSDRILFKDIHTKYTYKLRENPSLDIHNIKKELLNTYNLKNKEVHLFLLDKFYTITHSTYKPDIGFKLADVPDARIELDRSKDGNIYQSDNISIDIINSEIKSYSYSKINDQLYFEMAFINLNIHNSLKNMMAQIKLLTHEKTALYRIEKRLDGSEYYDDLAFKNTTMSKEKYISSKKKFMISEKTDNPIILSNRENRIIREYEEDSLIVYIPLVKQKNNYLNTMGDLVLKLYIDKSLEMELSNRIERYFFIFMIFHILFLIIIFIFTKKYHDTQLKLNEIYKENQSLVDSNKSFIDSITNQMQSPLSVIINNYDFIKRVLKKDLKKYDEQISSSINMLENSYEDLNYIVNNEKRTYTSVEINLRDFVSKRIEFFDVIAKSRTYSISSNLDKDIFIYMNEIELERLVDNNLSNAIKHGKKFTNIYICLKKEKEKEKVVLSFYSYGNEIKDKKMIFEKNYQENNSSAVKSLGLGLSMVKNICNKYNVNFNVSYEKGQNVFEYTFYES